MEMWANYRSGEMIILMKTGLGEELPGFLESVSALYSSLAGWEPIRQKRKRKL